MWFSSVFVKTLRECRVAVLGWGLGIGLLMFEIQAAIGSLLRSKAADLSLQSLAGSFNWAGDPVALNTVGGYATWKNGIAILMMAIWPLIAWSRILRGAEERGSMDLLLAQPRGRIRVALESLLAVWTALAVMGAIVALVTFAGGRDAGASYNLTDALLFALNLVLICGVFGSIALLVSQFTAERSRASGITGGLLFLFIVLDMMHRVIPGTLSISRISPVFYYNLSKPLVPSFGTDAGALALLAAVSVALSAAAIVLFARRDVRRTVPLPRWLTPRERIAGRRSVLPATAWSLRSVYSRGLAMAAAPTVWWTIGIAGFASFMVVVVKQIEDKLAAITSGSSFLQNLVTKVGGGDVATNAVLLSALFIFLPVLSMAFAVTQSSQWVSDEEEGRHELILSTPSPRLNLLLGRYAAVGTSAVFIALITLGATAVASWASGLALKMGDVAAATLSLIPQCLLMASLGYLFAGWLRSAVENGILSFLLTAWFFISFVGPELNWSGTILKLSAFYYYGTPLEHGLPLGDMLIVLAVGSAALAIASLRFVRKDIGTS